MNTVWVSFEGTLGGRKDGNHLGSLRRNAGSRSSRAAPGAALSSWPAGCARRADGQTGCGTHASFGGGDCFRKTAETCSKRWFGTKE